MNAPLQFGRGEKPPSARPLWQAVYRGAKKRCPQCTQDSLFSGYLQTSPKCKICELTFSHHKADDAPPYFTIIIVGHVVIPVALAVKQAFDPPLWMQFFIWMPIILLATFLLLPVMKGALIGLQWAKRMHGFAEKAETAEKGPKTPTSSRNSA